MEQPTGPTWRDALVPLGLLTVGALELASLGTEGWLAGIGLEALASALLVLRRWRPLVFATAGAVVLGAMPWFGPQLDDAAAPILYLAVAVYALARWVADLRGLVGVGVVLATLFFDHVTVDVRAEDWSDAVFLLALTVPPYVVGRITRKLADQAELLRRNQELVRREAVRAERDRIARELHDVIAHSVSAMVVQTAAAQDLVRTAPERAEAVLADVASTGRRALVETGRLLHVLRDEAGELGLDPAPGVADLPALVDGFRRSGLAVALEVDEPVPALAPGLDVSAYRIVQEALTNALKHGSGRRARVRLSADAGELRIVATNPVGEARGTGSGLGLVGIGERVALLGGRLEHTAAEGEFRLSVTLPLEAGAVAPAPLPAAEPA
ncbi:sensor histidine kinase [Nocardioides caldifontis]|uniref:sensor histidine kinase n=1 Tax=Nocardioides caldifontis TaxID=2588938 RepID=UPI0011DF142C|nr:sensor histidine kinase [Nocardioides caldifontis]